MRLKEKIIAFLGFWVVTLYAKTWRYNVKNRAAYDKLRKQGKNPVVVIWHDQIYPCSFYHHGEGVVTIASDSKDGELITYVMNGWGYKMSRGSSSKGGLKAALNAIKLSKSLNASCAVTVDGPRGPRHIVKEGAVLIAKKLSCVAIIVVMQTTKAKRFASWDKFILPYPFAKIDFTYSEPVYFDDATDAESMKRDTELLQKKMLEHTNANSPLFI